MISAAWGLVAGVITVAACLVPLGGFSQLSRFQSGWLAVAGLASTFFTGYTVFAAARSAAVVDRVDGTVTEIDLREKNQAIALMAKVFSMSVAGLVRVFAEPDLFDSVIDSSLAALHIALCRCHGLDENRIRVSLIIQSGTGYPELNGATSVAAMTIRTVPGDQAPRFDFTDHAITDQMHAVMSRRHPYQSGWLWDGFDGSPARREYHVLSPAERDVCSYIRVGVPGLGVLCVDSTDDVCRLVVADRELALAFADVLAIPGWVRLPLAAQVPVVTLGLARSEEATS